MRHSLRLLCCALALCARGARGSAPLPDGAEELDAGLFHGQLVASFAEWNATFGGSGPGYGLVHLWARCVGEELRGVLFAEDVNQAHPLLESAYMNASMYGGDKLVVLINGLPIFTEFANVARFAISTRTLAHLPVLTLGVRGWGHYLEFPMRLCSPPPAPLPAPAHVMSVFTWDNPAASAGEASRFVHTLARGLEQHSRYHRCVLNISWYEVTVQEDQLGALLGQRYVAEQVRRGFYRLLVKNNHPARVWGSRPMWQGVYYNLALLRHWRGGTVLWFLDPDEFLVVRPGGEPRLGQLLREGAGMSLQRRAIRPAEWEAGSTRPEALDSIYGRPFLLGDGWLLPKVSVNPERSGCVTVHFSVCGKQLRTLDVGFVAHFTNWLNIRNNHSTWVGAEAHTFERGCRSGAY